MLILLVEVVYWAYVAWGGHRRVEYVQALVSLGDPGYVIYLVSVVKIVKVGKDIASDGLSWVRTEFFVCGGVG